MWKALPVALGGLGVPSAASRAAPAFLASVVDTLDTQERFFRGPEMPEVRPDFFSTLEAFAATYSTPADPVTVEVLQHARKTQQWLARLVDVAAHKRLLESVDERTQAVMRSASLSYSGGFITLPPWPHLRIPTVGFRMLLRYRLGLPLLGPVPGPAEVRLERCPLCRKDELDRFGDHAASCRDAAHPTKRHDAVAGRLASIMRATRICVRQEAAGIVDGRRRPADVLIHGLSARPWCVDVLVSCPTVRSHRAAAAREAGAASVPGIREKHRKYADFIAQRNYKYSVLALETTGGFAPSASHFLKVAASVMAVPPSERVPGGGADMDEDALDRRGAAQRLGCTLSIAFQQAWARTLELCYPAAFVPPAMRVGQG